MKREIYMIPKEHPEAVHFTSGREMNDSANYSAQTAFACLAHKAQQYQGGVIQPRSHRQLSI